MKEIILINVAGEDKPGVTSSITGILAQYDVTILDIGQAVIHNNLSLGILAELPGKSESSPVLKDILFSTHEMGMAVRFEPISEKSYSQWVGQQGKRRHIVTLLSRKITARQLAEVTSIIADNGLNIDDINRMSGRIPLDSIEKHNKACVEFSVRGQPNDTAALRTELMELSNRLGVDIAYQQDNVFRRNRRLVAFDMDSTLIKTEIIDELAKVAGVGEKVTAITEKAMRGEIDFTESFKQRVALMKGLDESELRHIADNLPLTEGAEKLVATIRKLGYKTAILSGGFNTIGRVLQRKLGIDYVFANELEIADGRITGNVIGKVVDGQRKAQLLQEIADNEDISLDQVIAVGDGANDLPMLKIAGLGIAFRAKPIVKKSAGQSISTMGLDGILYLIGIRDRETAHYPFGF